MTDIFDNGLYRFYDFDGASAGAPVNLWQLNHEALVFEAG